MRAVTPSSTSRAPVFLATPMSYLRSKVLRNEVRTQSPRAGAMEARKEIVPTHERDSVRARSNDDIPPGGL
jgi:hypothetical protein